MTDKMKNQAEQQPETSNGVASDEGRGTTGSALPVERRTYLTALAAGTVAAGEATAQSSGTDERVQASDSEPVFSYGWPPKNSSEFSSFGYGYGPYGGSELPAVSDDLPPRSIDQSDDLYRDVRGESWRPNTSDDTGFNILDVQSLFDHMDDPAVTQNSQSFNFSGNDPSEVTLQDVQALFEDL